MNDDTRKEFDDFEANDQNQSRSGGNIVPPQSGVQLDPNAINNGSIKGPVVIFFGPREVGKTVTLIRLSNFVKQKANIQIRSNPTFRTDRGYEEVQNSFKELLEKQSEYKPERTGNIDFLLLDYFEKGKLYCQFLEAPGEHFFDPVDPQEPNKPYIAYFDNLRMREIKKIYVFFFEENMFKKYNDPPSLRRQYASKVSSVIQLMKPERDRILILYNKVDEHGHLITNGRVNVETLREYIYNNPEYDELKNTLQNSKLKHIYFVPFSSGKFPQIHNTDEMRWIVGEDEYPARLWGSIRNSIDRKWGCLGFGLFK